MNPDRAENCVKDVVAVERLAPGLVRVVTWSDAYHVDARDAGCNCPDKQYNLAPGENCKHETAAILADRDDVPVPFDVCDDLTRRVATDGGQVVEEDPAADKWTLVDTSNDNNARHFDSRSEAEDTRSDLVGLGAAPEDLEIYDPGEAPDSIRTADGGTGTGTQDEDETEEHTDDATGDTAGKCDICNVDLEMGDEAVTTPDGRGVHKICLETNGRVSPEDDPDPEDADEADDDGTEAVDPEIVDHAPDAGSDDDRPDAAHEPEVLDAEDIEQAAAQLPEERHVDEDPIRWLPGEFVDRIDGSPAINRKGFEVLAYHYDVDVSAELEVAPEATDHEYARVKATARMGDRTVEAFGSAHVDRGDDHYLLLEMADTRSRKRALSIITGAGAVAVDELMNSPEGE